MNIEELLRIVNAEGLDAPVIYGEGNIRNDAVVLERDGDIWKVYVADERGGMYESTFREYGSEAEALEHVLLKLRQFKKYSNSLDALASRVNKTIKNDKDQLLSQAIITYLSKGKSSFPKHDEDSVKVLATNAGIDPEMLLDAVRAITMECASIEIDWSNHSLAEGGQEVQRVMAKRHPELEKNAVDALAWMFTYMWR